MSPFDLVFCTWSFHQTLVHYTWERNCMMLGPLKHLISKQFNINWALFVTNVPIRSTTDLTGRAMIFLNRFHFYTICLVHVLCYVFIRCVCSPSHCKCMIRWVGIVICEMGGGFAVTCLHIWSVPMGIRFKPLSSTIQFNQIFLVLSHFCDLDFWTYKFDFSSPCC